MPRIAIETKNHHKPVLTSLSIYRNLHQKPKQKQAQHELLVFMMMPDSNSRIKRLTCFFNLTY